jgi:iron complex outermembrane receptor protein
MTTNKCGLLNVLNLTLSPAVAAVLVVAGLGSPRLLVAAGVEAEVGLQEIVVTATKREESILTVPISVAVIGAQEIQALGMQTAEDFSRFVPGLLVEKSCEQCDGFYYNFRGLSGGGNTSLSSVYIDDTPLTFGGTSPTLNLFDVERVEVLRGPQGTLFGSSAMSGAIRYVTPQPDYSKENGTAKIEYGQVNRGGQSYEAEAAFGAPIVDDVLAFRASAFKRHDGGYIDQINEDTGAPVDRNINSAVSYGGRFAMAGRTGPVEVIASVLFQNIRNNALDTYYTSRGESPDEVPLEQFQVGRRVPTFVNSKVTVPTVTVKADLGLAELTSITSYLTREWVVQSDFSYVVENIIGPNPALLQPNDMTDRDGAFTQEIRLASKVHDSYDWIVGAYFRHTTEFGSQSVNGNLFSLYPGFASAALPGGFSYISTQYEARKQKALFGEASYKPFNLFKITGGVRVSDLSSHSEVYADGLFNGGPSSKATAVEARNIVTPKVSISREFASTTMAYATYSTGFREGGSNPLVPLGRPECVAALASLGLKDAPATYGSDKIKNFELGLKGESADHRFDYKTAVYYIKWTDLQSGINLGNGCNFGFTSNIGAARTEGLELESSWSPIDPLRFGLNLGYSTGEYTKDQVIGSDSSGPIYGARKGSPITDFPKWTISASSQYDYLVTANWKHFVRVDYQYLGSSTQSNNISQGAEVVNFQRDAYSFVSLRFGANTGPYEFALFVKNLANTHPLTYASCCGQGGSAILETIQPRYIAVSASMRF